LRRVPVGSVTWRHTFRALRHRNYRLFFWGQLVSLIGTWMQQTAMSWFVYQITNSKLLLGIVAAIGSAPMMLSSIWGGSLADRQCRACSRSIGCWFTDRLGWRRNVFFPERSHVCCGNCRLGHDALTTVSAAGARRLCQRTRLERHRIFTETSASADDPAALPR